MRRFSGLLPQGDVARARLVTMLPSVMVLLGMIPQVLMGGAGPARQAAGLVAEVLLAAFVAGAYRRRRPLPGDALAVPALTVVAGSSLLDPLATIGIGYGLLIGLSLYGSRVRAALLTAGLMVAVLGAVAAHPPTVGKVHTWHDPSLLVVLPQLGLLSALARGLHHLLLRQERIGEQQALLARTGSRLLAARDGAEVDRLAAETSERLAALAPGIAVLFVRHDGGMLTTAGTIGVAPVTLDATLVAGLDADDPDTIRPVPAGLAPAIPGIHTWYVAGLTSSGGDHFLVCGGGRGARPADFALFRSLGQQIALAHASCDSRLRLHHQAHHDQLTGLPGRALFTERLAGALAADPAGVTLLYVDLDDFKPVNDRFGHAAGDEVLVVVAARLREAAGPDGVAARFGGDEFGVLLPGLSGAAEARARGEQIRRRLREPIPLSATEVTIGASVGVARCAGPATVHDLMRRADAAMYEAKQHGKQAPAAVGS